ncbi:metal dependent phosphohydrolase domain protein [Yersinia ruckeri]|nr:metal dependent phosphohydrolase domain protein [Yersinia ruckeri]
MSFPPPILGFCSLTNSIQFLMEIDKLKSIQRHTKLIVCGRQDNSAVLRWHFALAARRWHGKMLMRESISIGGFKWRYRTILSKSMRVM